MRDRRVWGWLGVALALALAAAWIGFGRAGVINSPYPAGAEATNTLFTAFAGRSPKYLDPASSYSTDETAYTYSIYEPLYGYHYLKRPYELVPRAAEAVVEPQYFDAQGQLLPDDAPGEEVAESVYTIPIKPGVMFQPHPAFARDADGKLEYHALTDKDLEGKRAIPDFPLTGTRELTAHDFVYQIRRLASPRIVSPLYAKMSEYVVGMKDYGDDLRARDAQERTALAPGAQRPWQDLRELGFEGAEALDDHTLRIRIKGKYPQFRYWLAMTFFAPMAWEAEAFYSQPGMAERNLSLNTWPVGTGPYLMAENLINRRMALARNPNFRGEPYPCEGSEKDRAEGLLADCGQMMPFIDGAVFNMEKEAVPLQGKFLQGYYDVPQIERGEYGVAFQVAAEDSADKAALFESKGLRFPTNVETQSFYMGFNWRDPVVGLGDTPEQQERNRKLRQAISIAVDWEEYVAIFENNQAEVANGPVPPGVLGYREGLEGVNPQVYDIKDGRAQRKSLDEAKRLLAEAGYPDGRNAVTGQPLVLYYDAMSGGGGVRPQFEWMVRQFARLGVQLEVRSTDYNRFQDKMRRGVGQIFLWGWNADYPDAENFLFLLYGPNAKVDHGGENAANYANPRFDALFEQMKFLEDGPRKEAVIAEMVALVQHDAPWMFGYFPMSGGAYQQWLGNAKPSQMVRDNLTYMRIDPALRAKLIAEWNQPVWWPVLLLALGAVLAVLPALALLRRRERATALGGVASETSLPHADAPASAAQTPSARPGPPGAPRP